jgi:hypothetical protein
MWRPPDQEACDNLMTHGRLESGCDRPGISLAGPSTVCGYSKACGIVWLEAASDATSAVAIPGVLGYWERLSPI